MLSEKQSFSKIPRYFRVPLFFDAVQDRVRSPWLGLLAILLVFCMISDLILTNTLRGPSSLLGENVPVSLVPVNLPSPVSKIGGGNVDSFLFGKKPSYRVLNSEGYGVKGVTVDIKMSSLRAEYGGRFLEFTCKKGDTDNMIPLDLLFLEEIFSSFCDPSISFSGSSAVSGENGIVEFPDFAIIQGGTGLLDIQFSVRGHEDVVSNTMIKVTSIVGSLKILDPPPRGTAIGEGFSDTIRVRALDHWGEPVPNKMVIASTYPILPGHPIAIYQTWWPNLRNPKVSLLENNKAWTGFDGIARFDALNITAANTQDQYLVFACEGRYDGLYESFSKPMIVSSEVFDLEILIQPPIVIIEGEVAEHPPSVKICDHQGQGIPGKFAFAMLSVVNGQRKPPYARASDWSLGISEKTLTGAVSLPSDPDGIATFPELRFSTHGPSGIYRITFFCDGVKSRNDSQEVRVQSSVDSVIVFWTSGNDDSIQGVEPGESLVGEDQGYPTILILNQHNQGVAGKMPQAHIVNQSDDKLISLSIPSDDEGFSSLLLLNVLGLARDQRYSIMFEVDGIVQDNREDSFLFDVRLPFALNDNGCSYIDLEDFPQEIVVGIPFNVTMTPRNIRGEALDSFYGFPILASFIGDWWPQYPTISMSDPSGTILSTDNFLLGGFDQQGFMVAIGSEYLGYNPDCFSSLHQTRVINPIHTFEITQPSPNSPSLNDFWTISITYRDSKLNLIPYNYSRAVLHTVLLFVDAPSISMRLPDGFLAFYGFLVEGGVGILYFKNHYPGNYSLGSAVATIPGPIISYHIDSPVHSLVILSSPSGPVFASSPFVLQPEVVILDRAGFPVPELPLEVFLCFENSTEVKFPPDVGTVGGAVGNMIPDMDSPNSWSIPSDINGTARWQTLGLYGAPVGSFRLKYVFGLGEDFEIFFISDETIDVTERLSLAMVTECPSLATSGTKFATSPVFQILSSTGSYLQYLWISASAFYLNSSTGELFPLLILSGEDVFRFAIPTATSNPTVLMNDLAFSQGVSGAYMIHFSTPGAPGVTSSIIEITDECTSLNWVKHPPTVVVVGQSFEVVLQAIHDSGSALPHLVVTAEVLGDNSRPQILPSRRSNFSDSQGTIRMWIIIESAKPGEYSLKIHAHAYGVSSKTSHSFSLVNDVFHVQILSGIQVAPKHSSISISNNQEEDMASIKNGPIVQVRVTKKDGQPIAGKRMTMTPLSATNLKWVAVSSVSGDDGIIEFNSLRFLDGNSGSHAVKFIVDGIESLPSDSFLINNVNRPDLSQFGNFETLCYVFMAFTIPMLFANSGWVSTYVVLALSMTSGLFVSLGFGGYAIYSFILLLNLTKGAEWRFFVVKFITIIISLLSVAPMVHVSILWLFGKRKKYYEFHKQRNFQGHVRNLLTLRPPRNPDTGKVIPELPSSDPHDQFLKRAWIWIKRKSSTPNPHGFLEKEFQPLIPQRIRTALSLSILVFIYSFLGAQLTGEYVNYRITQTYNEMVANPVSNLELEQTNEMGGGNILGAAYTQLLSSTLLHLVSEGEEYLVEMQDKIIACCWVSSVVALTLCFVVLLQFIQSYKRQVYEMRQGIFRGIRPSRFQVGTASVYIAMQVVHAALGYFLTFFLFWILSFTFSYSLVRQYLWERFGAIIIAMISTSTIITLIRMILVHFLTDGMQLKHRRLFGLFDYLFTFVAVASSIGKAAGRLVLSFVLFVVFFIRIDVPVFGVESLVSLDPAYSSYISVLLSDSQYNNPVFNLFCMFILEKYILLKKRHEKASDMESVEISEDPGALLRRRRARNRWWLVFTLMKNPSLRQYRSHALGQKGLLSSSYQCQDPKDEHKDIYITRAEELEDCFI